MEIVTGHIGWIEVVCGPMFSGKSEELIRRLRRARIARKRVQVFKPAIDDRYSVDEIVSHGDQRMKSEVVSDAKEISNKLDWRTQVIGIDESNFFGAGAGRRRQPAGRHRQAGDHRRARYRLPGPPVFAHAGTAVPGRIDHQDAGDLHALRQSRQATQRLVESEDLIVVGAAGMYEARCRRCFEPGVPKQEVMEFRAAGANDRPYKPESRCNPLSR